MQCLQDVNLFALIFFKNTSPLPSRKGRIPFEISVVFSTLSKWLASASDPPPPPNLHVIKESPINCLIHPAHAERCWLGLKACWPQAWDGILGHQFSKRLESFSPLLFIVPSTGGFWRKPYASLFWKSLRKNLRKKEKLSLFINSNL